MTPTVYLKILSKVNPELHQSLQDAATPVFHDPERIPAIYNQFTDTFALEKDPLIAKLKFISVILRLYSPASLIAEINVPHGVRSNLAIALDCRHASGVSHMIARARVYIRQERFKIDVENIVKWIEGREG